MIAFVSGKLVSKAPTEAVVDVGGVGYQVGIPTSSFEKLPEIGEPVRLLTVHHVREDTQALFGFVTDAERALFRHALSVSGVGPRLGLAILSSMSPTEVAEAVATGNSGALTRIPGVGRKTSRTPDH